MEIEKGFLGVTRHVRKTVAFDNTAGNGAAGAVTLFTITGRVWMTGFSAFCTETLTGAATTVSVGVASSVAGIIAVSTGTDIVANDWWVDATPAEIGLADPVTTQVDMLVSQTIICDVIGAAGVTDGTIVFDCWFVPITDNGNLS